MDTSMNVIAKERVYQWRIDAPNTPEIIAEIEDHIYKATDNYVQIYFVGQHEISDKGKPHYQLCLIFDKGVQVKAQHFRNIKQKSWISKTKQPVSFTQARKPDKLMSYCTKDHYDLITNMEQYAIDLIVPWKSKEEMKVNKYEYILEYTKKLLKEMSLEEYVSVYDQYFVHGTNDEKNVKTVQPGYEWGDKLDPPQKLTVMVNITKEYFRKFNIIMTKKTQLKIMIATKIMSFDEYVYTNFQNNNIFPV